MTLRPLLFAIAAGVLALPASAAAIDTLIGNALKLTSPSGAVTIYRIDPGGRYAALDEDGGVTASGDWTAENDRLCLTPRGGATFCVPFAEERAVGDEWKIAGPSGGLMFDAALIPAP